MSFLNRDITVYLLSICLSVVLVTQVPGIAFGQTKSIIAFGDSLTEGCDVHIDGNSVCGWINGGDAYGYWTELQKMLTADELDMVVYNYGLGGETTAQGLNRIDSVLSNVCNQEAEYILIMEGTNDLFHGSTWQNVLFNLDVMIDKSRAQGLEPLLATLTPDPEHEYKNIPLMNEKIREYAASKEPPVTLVDQYKAVEPKWDEYTNPRGCYGDLLHPNLSGFQAIAATWYDSLSQFFPKPKSLNLPWLMLLLGTP